MMVYYHEMVCHAEKLDHCLNVKVTVRAYNQKLTISTLSSKLLVYLQPNLV